MDKYTYYIKHLTLAMIMLFSSVLMFGSIVEMVRAQNYLTLGTGVYLQIITFMFITIVTASLTLGGWHKWVQYFVIPLPFCAGMFLNIYPFNLDAAALITLIAYFVIAEGIYLSYRMKNLLIKEEPKLVLKSTTRALLFVVAITAGIITIVNLLQPANQDKMYTKVDSFIGNIYDTAIKQIMQSDPTINEGLMAIQSAGVNVNSADADVLIKEKLLDQFHTMIEPYKGVFPVVAGLLVWSVVQLMAWLTSLVYSLTIGFIFKFAVRFGLFKVTTIEIKKEILSF